MILSRQYALETCANTTSWIDSTEQNTNAVRIARDKKNVFRLSLTSVRIFCRYWDTKYLKFSLHISHYIYWYQSLVIRPPVSYFGTFIITEFPVDALELDELELELLEGPWLHCAWPSAKPSSYSGVWCPGLIMLWHPFTNPTTRFCSEVPACARGIDVIIAVAAIEHSKERLCYFHIPECL